jgi:hypothetical protein
MLLVDILICMCGDLFLIVKFEVAVERHRPGPIKMSCVF